MELFDEFKRVKQVLEEAVREAEIAVRASVPSPEELERIKAAFDQSIDRAARMLAEIPQLTYTSH